LIEAVAGLKVTGTVERISPQATIKNNIKASPPVSSSRTWNPRVRPGMTANVKIPVASADNVTAVRWQPSSRKKIRTPVQMERFVYCPARGKL